MCVVSLFDGKSNITALPESMMVQRSMGSSASLDLFHVRLPHQIMLSKDGHPHLPWARFLVGNKVVRLGAGKVKISYDDVPEREAVYVIAERLGMHLLSYDVNVGQGAGKMVGEYEWKKNDEGLWYASAVTMRRSSLDGKLLGKTYRAAIIDIKFTVDDDEIERESKANIQCLPGTRVTVVNADGNVQSSTVPGAGAELQRHRMDSLLNVKLSPAYWKKEKVK